MGRSRCASHPVGSAVAPGRLRCRSWSAPLSLPFMGRSRCASHPVGSAVAPV